MQHMGNRKDSSFAMYSGSVVRRRKQKASALLTSVGEHWNTYCEAIQEHGPKPPHFFVVLWTWFISLIVSPCRVRCSNCGQACSLTCCCSGMTQSAFVCCVHSLLDSQERIMAADDMSCCWSIVPGKAQAECCQHRWP